MFKFKKVAIATLAALATTAGAMTVGTEAKADHHDYLYSYQTDYGYIQFYNYDGYWPVVKKVRYEYDWYVCSFWAKRYSCERERTAYRAPKSGGYSGGGYSGGGYGGRY